MLDRENPNNVFNQAAQRGSGYIGNVTIAAHADPGNTGIVTTTTKGIIKANNGDYVVYTAAVNTGTGANVWRTNYIYQWNGSRWNELSFPTANDRNNAAKYVEAAGGVTTGMPAGIFSRAQIGSLVADSVFAALMSAREYVVEDGWIHSKDYSPGLSGWAIFGDGRAEFNTVTVRGRVEADSGELNNVTIKETATFLGTIKTGPVYISNENTAAVTPRVFGSGTAIDTIRTYLGGNGTFNINGSYGSRTDLISIVTTTAKTVNLVIPPQNNIVSNAPVYSLRLIFSSGNDVYFENTPSPTYPPHSSITSATISQQLSIGGSVSGKVFRITDLPTGGAGLPPGTVYRNGNQLMIAT
jgi:hypothetical protein